MPGVNRGYGPARRLIIDVILIGLLHWLAGRFIAYMYPSPIAPLEKPTHAGNIKTSVRFAFVGELVEINAVFLS